MLSAFAGRQGEEQIGQGDVGAEPRHEAVTAVASRPIATLAVDTNDVQGKLGKADPHGAKPAKDNAATIAKAEALRDALERVEAELRRREAASQ